MHTRSHSNALGQCRDNTPPFNKASSYELSNGSKNIKEKKKQTYILVHPVLTILILPVFKGLYPYSPQTLLPIYPYYITLR